MEETVLSQYEAAIISYAKENYTKMFREADGLLKHKFIVPGSCYSNSLWDWDSWLTNIALRKIAGEDDVSEYERGCILNFCDHVDENGTMPIFIMPTWKQSGPNEACDQNIHKPVLAQHALFVCEQTGEYAWLSEAFEKIERYIGYYFAHCLHETGLFFWMDDNAIGVDNDPCTFYRPRKSSASIYLNCLMYRELLALSALAEKLALPEKAADYKTRAAALCAAVREHCWDERDGFYYSVDIGLLPIDPTVNLHSGCPRHWNCLIQRIDVWSGFLAMWAGIATPEQAERMVREHYLNDRTFHAAYGVRTLSKLEKMYALIKSGNPSCWLGPIWGISNYMTFDGLRRYGFREEATELAHKTIALFGKDILETGELHEYYDPDTGAWINNPGFQNWNLLVLDMIEWLHAEP